MAAEAFTLGLGRQPQWYRHCPIRCSGDITQPRAGCFDDCTESLAALGVPSGMEQGVHPSRSVARIYAQHEDGEDAHWRAKEDAQSTVDVQASRSVPVLKEGTHMPSRAINAHESQPAGGGRALERCTVQLRKTAKSQRSKVAACNTLLSNNHYNSLLTNTL